MLEGIAPTGAADGPIPSSFTAASNGKGGRVAFANAGAPLAFTPTADCVSMGGLPPNASATSCCQTLPEVVPPSPPPAPSAQCSGISGAGVCYREMAFRRLRGLGGSGCCAACAASAQCGAWEVLLPIPGGSNNTVSMCVLKPVGAKAGPCVNPNLPNTSASGAAHPAHPPAPPLPGGGSGWGFPFELQSKDGRYVAARGTIDGATVTLTPVTAPAAGIAPFVGFRYAWQTFPLCVLTNEHGLPAAPTSGDSAHAHTASSLEVEIPYQI